jgi:hypothetical protein
LTKGAIILRIETDFDLILTRGDDNDRETIIVVDDKGGRGLELNVDQFVELYKVTTELLFPNWKDEL